MVSPTITTLCEMIEHCRTFLDDLPDTSDIADAGDNLALLQQTEESQDQSNLLWTDNELILFANQAVSEVALRTRCLRDSSAVNGITSFAISAGGDPWVELDARLLRINRVLWNEKPLSMAESTSLLDECVTDWETLTGDPYAFVVDQSSRRIRPYKAPEADGTLRIEVIRLPVTSMLNPDDEPEIPVHMRADAVKWMCHLAYLKNDADTKDQGQADFYAGLFEHIFGPRPNNHDLEFGFFGSRRPRGKLYWY